MEQQTSRKTKDKNDIYHSNQNNHSADNNGEGMRGGWEIKRLSEVSKITYGYTDSASSKNIGPKFLRITDIQNNSVVWDDVPYCNCKNEELPKYKLEDGDIVFARTGATTGKSFLIKNPPNAVFASYLIRLKIFSKNILLPEFVALYFQTASYWSTINAGLSGSAQGGFNATKLGELGVPIPPLSEQKRIVEILDEAFAAIDKAKANIEKNLQNAKELFECYLQNVFVNKKNEWEEIRLEDASELISKGSSPKWQGVNYVEKPGVLFVTSENVGENVLLLNERKYVEEKFNLKDKKSILKKGDVLTNIVGASIGRTAIFDLDEIANINQAVCLIRCKQEILFNKYLMYLLNSPFTKQHLHDNEVNNARANLSLGFFRNLKIPIPSLQVQKSIVTEINRFHIETSQLAGLYQQKLSDLEELKKSILQKAFSGGLNYDLRDEGDLHEGSVNKSIPSLTS